MAGGFHGIDGKRLRRVTARVQPVQGVLDPDQRKGVAADRAARWLDHR